MPKSDSSSGAQKMSPGKKLGVFALWACATGAVKCFLDTHCGPGAAATIGPVLYYIGIGASELIPNLVADKISGTVLNGNADERGPSGLNGNIERALARAASRTYCVLISEWREIRETERVNDQHSWELDRIERACADYLEKSQPGAEPAIIADWLQQLSQADFPQFPDSSLVPWQHENAGAPPEPPVEFAAWFHWRFSAVFRLKYADELVKDERARAKFSLLLQDRILVLQKEGHTIALGNKKALDGLVATLNDPAAPWLRNVAQTVRKELLQFLPTMVDAVSADLSFEFRIIIEEVISEVGREGEMGREHTTMTVGDAVRPLATKNDVAHAADSAVGEMKDHIDSRLPSDGVQKYIKLEAYLEIYEKAKSKSAAAKERLSECERLQIAATRSRETEEAKFKNAEQAEKDSIEQYAAAERLHEKMEAHVASTLEIVEELLKKNNK